MAGLAAGAHAGLAVAWRCRSQRQAAAKESTPTSSGMNKYIQIHKYIDYLIIYLSGRI